MDLQQLQNIVNCSLDAKDQVFTWLYTSRNCEIFDGGILAWACRNQKLQIASYLMKIKPDDLWTSCWTTAILKSRDQAMLCFWLSSAPNMAIMDDLYILTPCVALHFYNLVDSKLFLDWLAAVDMAHLDFLYEDAFNPYRSFLAQRTALQHVLDAENESKRSTPLNYRCLEQ